MVAKHLFRDSRKQFNAEITKPSMWLYCERSFAFVMYE